MGALLDTTNYLVTSTVMINVLGAESGEYDEVDRVINAASWFANRVTQRNLRSRAYSGTDDECYYDGDGSQLLVVRQYPIVSVSALYIDSERDYGSDTLIDSGSYVIYKDRGIIRLEDDIFTAWPHAVKLEYTAGYATIPWDLVQAVKDLVVFWYERQDAKRVGKKSVTTQGETTSYETEIPRAVLDVFKRYRKRA